MVVAMQPSTPLLPSFTATRRMDTRALEGKVLCVDALALLAMLPDNSVDMILTSPPYDNLRTYNGFTWDFEGIARETFRVLKQGGVLVWVVGDATVNGSETLTSMRQALYFVDVCGFKMHDTMIWQKEAVGDFGKRYVPAFEYMLVLSKDTPVTFNPLKRKNKTGGKKNTDSHNSKNGWKGNGMLRIHHEESVLPNVWGIPVGKNVTTKDIDAFNHPAMFPEKLAYNHIYSWSNPGDIVLDYFMGSGTTAKIARNLGRKFIGCDLSAEYVALANRRLQNTDPFADSVLPTGERQLSLFRDIESVPA
jgi:DNA modification methylase